MLPCCIVACNNQEMKPGSPDSIELPYTASYTTEFTNDVSDSTLLLVLNSYKYWENGDLKALRSTMGDSMYVEGSEGFKFRGHTD